MATGITTQPVVETETFNCPKCGTVITIPKDLCTTGGSVNCTQCGTSFRRLARPGYFGRYVDASSRRKFKKNTDYYYYDENEDAYYPLSIKDSTEFKAAIENYKILYKLIQWEAKPAFTAIEKPTATQGYDVEVDQLGLDGFCCFDTGIPSCNNIHLKATLMWSGQFVDGQTAAQIFDTDFSRLEERHECYVQFSRSTADPTKTRPVFVIHGKKNGAGKYIPLNKWFDLEISVHDGVMRVFIDKEEIMSVNNIPLAAIDTKNTIKFGHPTRSIFDGYPRNIGGGFKGLIKSLIIGDTDGGQEFEFFPVISAGRPCLFNKFSKVSIPNSCTGTVVAGSVTKLHSDIS